MNNHREYLETIRRIEALADEDPDPGSQEGRELDRLTKEVMEYEDNLVRPINLVLRWLAAPFRLLRRKPRREESLPSHASEADAD